MSEHHGLPTPNPHAERTAPPEFARDAHPADLTPLLKHLLTGDTLSEEQTTYAFEAMMTGRVHLGEIGALLALLATRTEAAAEIVGAARVMRKHVDRLSCEIDPKRLVDTAGTGGAPKTFNVSTAAAIIAAGAGAKVPKHGNRSRTGRGSAEVLAKLGVDVDAGRDAQRRCLERAGVCFCFAIHHHPATKHVMPVRHALGFPTIFNLLGPLTNPAGASRQVLGVYDDRFVRPIADALLALDSVRAMVVHSVDGLDEFSISAPTRVIHVQEGALREETVDPERVGLKPASRDAVTARDLDHAADLVRSVLDGSERGPARDMAVLNAAGTLIVADLAESWSDAIDLARETIDRGKAKATLEKLIALSRST
jgi:anthranilate phosphoribosyltransferase